LIDILDEKTKKEIIGAEKEAIFVFDVKNTFKNDADLAGLLNIEKENLSEINDNFEFTIISIQNSAPAELNQEFFDKVFGEDKIKSEEEFRNKILEAVEEQYKAEAKVRFRFDFRNALKDSLEMPLPEEFIIQWQMNRRKKETEESIRKDIDAFKDAIKWDKIITILAKEHNLEIEQKDILDSTKANLVNQIAQMGLSVDMFTEEQLDKFANQELEKLNENDKYHLIFTTMERKVLDGLYEKVEKDQKEISFDELKAIYDEENKKIAEGKVEENKEENKEEGK
ncbi:MAG: hypothetical protein U9Q83_00675, partial [Bacteroidota bacterium]|nr:hypothetical protein [Bacteroidota bacterium]